MITNTTSFLRPPTPDNKTISDIYDKGGPHFFAGVASNLDNIDVFDVLTTGVLHRLSDFVFTHDIEPEDQNTIFPINLSFSRWPLHFHVPTNPRRVFRLIIHPYQMYTLRNDPRYADLFRFSTEYASLFSVLPGACLMFHDIRHPATTFIIYQSELVRCPWNNLNASDKRIAILMGKNSNLLVATWASNPFACETS